VVHHLHGLGARDRCARTTTLNHGPRERQARAQGHGEQKKVVLTEEKIKDISDKMSKMFADLETLKGTSIETLWNTELLNLDF
jgi:hypothetical protein